MIDEFISHTQADFFQEYPEVTYANVVNYMFESGYGCFECARNKLIIKDFWHLYDSYGTQKRAIQELEDKYKLSKSTIYFIVFPEKRRE